MERAIQLQPRDRELIVALTHRVRFLTAGQVARAWWPNTVHTEAAERRLRELRRAGYLRQTIVHARPELPLDEPVFRWTPGAPPPRFAAVSHALRRRWRDPVQPTAVVLAARAAAARFGGAGGRLKRALQATHDLHVAAVYLRVLLERPEIAEGWASEDLIAPSRRGQKLPDAIIHDPTSRPLLVIEFGGEYDAERVERVHADCARRGLPYELW